MRAMEITQGTIDLQTKYWAYLTIDHFFEEILNFLMHPGSPLALVPSLRLL
jgi:hypothetical protein